MSIRDSVLFNLIWDMLFQNSLKYDGTNESTERTEKGISETGTNKEAVDTSVRYCY